MLFPTLDFGIFFLIVFTTSWALVAQLDLRKVFLVSASYVFYGYWDWRFCLLLLASSLVNYIAGRLIDDPDASPQFRKWVLRAAVAANLASLGFFKYYEFFIASLNDLMWDLGLERELPFLEIVLPVGISFFTFQGISYVVDIYRRDLSASRSALDVMLYISFFPQLVAGPIVRAQTLLPQIEARPDPSRVLVTYGILLVVVGLFKKIIVANYLATEMVDIAFFDPTVYGPIDLSLAIWGYAIQIYCDFSAYSDIAIGVAALLGFRFQKNFNQPYRAESVRELWRRWHISLSTWLRDYVYIPIGGDRGPPWRTRLNMFLTMLLGGIWHGAAWTYVFWGSLHGAALVLERWLGLARSHAQRPVWRRALAVALTFNFTCLAYIFFRAETFDDALLYLASFGNWQAPIQFLSPFLIALVGFGFAAHFLPEDSLERCERRISRLPLLVRGAMAGFAVAAIDALGPEGIAPFIYFQF